MNKTNDLYGWIWAKVKSALGGKVDKEKGKGLSTNDFTNEDKLKIENVKPITQSEIDILFEKEC